ncbi:hypothetical protein NYE70_11320 [Paenibacillus sp. FSL R5-0407]|uniref:hypothetical protein n=1 Tax=Paenibacillus sp. FSL R5-0407 TaxID=2975320 RepID=UPI0030F4DB90
MSEPIEDKDKIIASLREQLCEERENTAHWICKYHGEANLFRKQNHTLGRLRADIAWIRERFEAEWTYELGTGEVVLEILERLEKAAGVGTKSAIRREEN